MSSTPEGSPAPEDYRDPVARRFDNLLALGVYVLLVASVFTFWLSALIGVIVAYACKGEADPVGASHYRFQIKVFWIGCALFTLAVVAGIGAGGAIFGSILAMALGGFSDWTWPEAVGSGAAGSAGAAVGLIILAMILWFASSAWTVLAALWGGLKLVRGRAMGQSRAVATAKPMRLDP